MCGEDQHIRLFGTEWGQRLFVSSDPLLLLAVFYLSNLDAMLLLSLSSIDVFMLTALLNLLTALLNLLTACLPPSLGLAVHIFLHKLIPVLSKPYARVNQYLLSFFPLTGKLWNSLPASVFPPVYDLSAFKRGVWRHLGNKNWSSLLTVPL